MDEKAERRVRRTAIRLLILGKKWDEVLQRVQRSRGWLAKWRARFGSHGVAGLRSRSRRPRAHPRAWSRGMARVIVQTRHRLGRTTAGLIGARAIRHELRGIMPRRRLPSEATIHRVLRRAGVIGSQPPRGDQVYFPTPVEAVEGSIDALDWTCRYLRGGAKVYAFHTLNLRTRAMHQTLARAKELGTARQHVLAGWQLRGLPRFLQLDNDALFCGGYKSPRVFGQFTRLCLYVGIELIFLPFGEPKRNFQVEQLNGLWGGAAFWERHRFRDFAHVGRLSAGFIEWYMQTYTPPALHGLTPAQAQRTEYRPRLTRPLLRHLPAALPITAGRIHFLRRVHADGTIRVLNELWRVPRALAGQYVWATLTIQCQTLDFWVRRDLNQNWRLIKQVRYDIAEPIYQLEPCFARLFTMS
jgi:putative transposase